MDLLQEALKIANVNDLFCLSASKASNPKMVEAGPTDQRLSGTSAVAVFAAVPVEGT